MKKSKPEKIKSMPHQPSPSEKAATRRLARMADGIVKSATQKRSGAKPALHLLRPLNSPALTIPRGKDRALTQSGMLQQALALNRPGGETPKIVSGFRMQLDQALDSTGHGVVIEKLLPFAANALERDLFNLIHETKPELFAECSDPLKALLQLRILYVPMVCRGLLNHEIEKNKSEMLWLGALSAYSVAFERTLLERMYSAASKARFASKDSNKIKNWAASELGGTIFRWFDKAEKDFKFWLSRFDQWLEYAMRSLDHYYGCQSIDYRRRKGKTKVAAQLGILKSLGAIPDAYVADLLEGVMADSQTRQMFRKNAKKRPTTPSNIEFEHWLIECWPLVLGYGWNYLDLKRAASLRFPDLSQEKLSEEILALKDRCKKLGLKLGRGSKKVGRPTKSMVFVNPLLYQVALMIDGLEDSEWFFGNTKAGFKTFASPSGQD